MDPHPKQRRRRLQRPCGARIRQLRAFAGAPLVAAVLVVLLLQAYKLKKGWEERMDGSNPAAS